MRLLYCLVSSFAVATAHPTSPPSTAAGRWTNLPAISAGAFQEHTTAAVRDEIFVIGGIDPARIAPPNFPSTNAMLAYSIPKKTWRTVASLPLAMNHVNSATVNGKVYVVGGMVSNPEPVWTPVPDCFVYDPKTDKWTALPPMPLEQARGASAVGVSGHTIFLAGGVTRLVIGEGGLQESVDTVTAYDVRKGTWTVLPNLPAPRDHVGGAVVGRSFFVVGGRDHGQSQVRNTTFTLDIDNTTAGWRLRAPLPTARGGLSVGVIRDTIVAFGGEGNPAPGSNGVFNQTEAYDVHRNAWRKLDPMPHPRHGTIAASAGGKIYIPGGGIALGGAGPVDIFDAFEL